MPRGRQWEYPHSQAKKRSAVMFGKTCRGETRELILTSFSLPLPTLPTTSSYLVPYLPHHISSILLPLHPCCPLSLCHYVFPLLLPSPFSSLLSFPFLSPYLLPLLFSRPSSSIPPLTLPSSSLSFPPSLPLLLPPPLPPLQDLGQKKFGNVVCPDCGMVYNHNEEQDRKEHKKFHSRSYALTFRVSLGPIYMWMHCVYQWNM